MKRRAASSYDLVKLQANGFGGRGGLLWEPQTKHRTFFLLSFYDSKNEIDSLLIASPQMENAGSQRIWFAFSRLEAWNGMSPPFDDVCEVDDEFQGMFK